MINIDENLLEISKKCEEEIKTELKKIAKLTNAKVFDGKTSLLNAFKEVRGYN